MKNLPYTTTAKGNKRAIVIKAVFAKMMILSCSLTIGSTGLTQSKYIRKFRPIADSLSAVYGVPTSVMLGIAIMESGSGTSRNCKLLNNHFGIVGKNNLVKTKGIKSRYKQYPDALASYVGFCKLMTKKKFYKRLKDNMDHKLWADAISKAGYSEIPDIWKQRLLSIIKKNRLSSLQ
jgi:flagellum-specific peptidoglycan hydrolase FlgJ